MNSDVVKVPLTFTIKQTNDYIKKVSPEFDSIYYVYVVDDKDYLKGVVSIRTILINEPQRKMKELMQSKMITVFPDDSIPDIAKKLTKYNLFSIAVVDKKESLLGVVAVDDVLRFYIPDA